LLMPLVVGWTNQTSHSGLPSVEELPSVDDAGL